jgi:hypothetical protein
MAKMEALYERVGGLDVHKKSVVACRRFTSSGRLEGFAAACQLAPAVPHLISGSCSSSRTFVPRVLQTPPHEDALALPLSFGSTSPWTGDFHSRA